MIPLHSVLAIRDIMHKLPILAAILCAVVLAIAFIIGCVKGFRRTSWNGVAWGASGLTFIIANKLLKTRNPILSIPAVAKLSDGMKAFVSSFSLALACALICLSVYGVFLLIFKQKRIRKRAPKSYLYSGYEYEDDYDDYDDYDAPNRLLDPRLKKPTLVGRIAGGVVCMLNAALILILGISFVVLFISSTALMDGSLGYLFDVKIVSIIRNYASVYALDFLTIGVIVLISCMGYKYGLVGSLRAVIVLVGLMIAAVVSFWLPFSSFVGGEKAHFLTALVERCTALVDKFIDRPRLISLGGKALAGCCIFAISAFGIWLISFILAKCCVSIRGSVPARVIDGVLACLLYFFVAIVVVLAIWSFLYVLDCAGIFKTTEIFNENSALAKGMFEFCERYVKPILKKALSLVDRIR